MGTVSDRRSVSAVCLAARILGTLIGFMAVFGVIQWLTYHLPQLSRAKTSDYLIWVGFILVSAGCVIGWSKELLASLFILGGIFLLVVVALIFPSEFRAVHFLSVPAILGFLLLYVHLAGKKK